jgi:hypothetical protein
VSYDLSLFRPIAGVDPIESYHRIMEDASSGDTLGRARELMEKNPGMDRLEAYLQAQEQEDVGDVSELPKIADLLVSRVPGFTRHQKTRGHPWIELSHPAQVQVLVTNREIGITMPYFRKDVDDKMAVVGACLDTFAEVGFVAYDPQFDKIVTAADFGAMKAQYRETDKILPNLVRDARRRRPWWKFW